MRRLTGSMLMVAALSGCVSTEGGGGGRYMSRIDSNSSMIEGASNRAYTVPTVPGFQGPNGAPIAMAAPYNSTPPGGEAAARAMLASSQPLDILQQTKYSEGSTAGVMPNGAMRPGNLLAPPGVPGVPGMPGMAPPPSAFVGGPGGRPNPIQRVNYGVHPTNPGAGGYNYPPGVVAAAGNPGMMMPPQSAGRTQILFSDPAGMKVAWFAAGADGNPSFAAQALDLPGRYNFLAGAIYRLKLSSIPNRPEVNLYPTLEVLPATPKTAAFLAHSAVPVAFTEEDFQQIAAGHYVVKVIYLPDPQYQDLAGPGGPDEIVSSRLEPGVDPIAEATKRGSILVVVRLGKIDLELPTSPGMDAPPPGMGGPPGGLPPGAMGGMPGMPPGMGGMPGMPPGMGGMPGMGGPGGQPLPGLPGGPRPMMSGAPSNLPPGVVMPPNGAPRALPGGLPSGNPGASPLPALNGSPASVPTGPISQTGATQTDRADIQKLVNMAGQRSGR